MSRLLDIFSELRETQAELNRVEKVIADNPGFESLSLDLFSLEKRQRRLEEELRTVADQQQIDVLDYRLMPADEGRIPLRAVTSALNDFQAAISTIYDALKNGIKQRGRLSAEIIQKSSFDFGYTFAGSLGVVLTIPNDREMFEDTDLDRAVETFFAGTKLQSTEDIRRFSQQIGIPSVRKLHAWARAHADYGVSADIRWRRKEIVRAETTVDATVLLRLSETIEQTSDAVETAEIIDGILMGLDVDYRSFHLSVADAEDITGYWDENFAYDPEMKLRARYRARLRKKVTTHYAYDKADVSWVLVGLNPIL